ncbi:hypothetical protein BDR07DRAFT_1500201 [Suillus spraguei]|nr:hypothetical protein BDR07DRAFT_1500502 [Suillus spraguei]KAG2351818.1 hypothetical protein BDR07DRAFT_1500201 [Suillus spraguei]
MEQEKEEDKNDFKTAAEHIEDAVDTLYKSSQQPHNSALPTPPVITQPTATPPAFPTYSSVAAANLPPSIDQAVARASLEPNRYCLTQHQATLSFRQKPPMPPLLSASLIPFLRYVAREPPQVQSAQSSGSAMEA